MWGLLALYWPLLAGTAALEILAHRVVWTLVVVALALTLRHRWRWLVELLATPRALLVLVAAALLISVNWWLYIWAVTHRHVVEASLGYYINPLVSVLLAVVVLGERLDLLRWCAVGLAALGVTWLTLGYGQPPWISLVLAFSFAGYGLLKKLATVGSLESVGVETAVLAGPALVYLGWLATGDRGAFLTGEPGRDVLLAGAGLVTAAPLLLFATAATRIPLSTLGLLQYLNPTLQLLIGVFLLGETVDAGQLAGFALVWMALILLSVAILRDRQEPAPVAPEAQC